MYQQRNSYSNDSQSFNSQSSNSYSNDDSYGQQQQQNYPTPPPFFRQGLVESFKVNKRTIEFEDKIDTLDLHKKIKDILINDLKFERLTKIQKKAFEMIEKKKNVVISSETGSGKTMAYFLPLLDRIAKESQERKIQRADGTYYIFLVPTRELCMQSLEFFKKVTKNFPFIVCGMMTGGENSKTQKKALRKGVTFLVATPLQLLYHLKNTQAFNVSNLKALVLDEVDELITLGHKDQVAEIFEELKKKIKGGNNTIPNNNPNQEKTEKPENGNPNIQIVVCSATVNENIRSLISYLSNSYEIVTSVEKEEQEPDKQKVTKVAENDDNPLDLTTKPQEEYSIPSTLHQEFVIFPNMGMKLIYLVAFLLSKTNPTSLEFSENKKSSKIIVFFNYPESVEFFHSLFTRFALPNNLGIPTPLFEMSEKFGIFKLHSDLSQAERKTTVSLFNSQETSILFTTDIAARGLDFMNVEWIVQVDLAADPKEYIHRVGRTARMGKIGNSILLLSVSEKDYLKLLKKYNLKLKETSGVKPLEHLAFYFDSLQIPEKRNMSIITMKNVLIEELTNFISSDYKNSKEAKDDLRELAINGYLGMKRGYTSHHPDTRFILHAKNLNLVHLRRFFALPKYDTSVDKHVPTFGRILKKFEADAKKPVYRKNPSFNQRGFQKTKRDAVSEFDSGIEQPDNKKRRFDI